MLDRRENEADLYSGTWNLHIPINKRLREDKEVGVGCSQHWEVFSSSGRSARRDKETSETKNMQTTALHASLTAHQTFIA